MDPDDIIKLASSSGPYVADSLIVSLGVLVGRSAPVVLDEFQVLWAVIATLAVALGLYRILVRGSKGGSSGISVLA